MFEYLTGLVEAVNMGMGTEEEGVKMTDMFMFGRYQYACVGAVSVLGIVI